MKPISYYLSAPVEHELLDEIQELDIFSRYMLSSALFSAAALKQSKNFGAVKYSYATIRAPRCRAFAMANSYLDIADLAAAVGLSTNDAILNETTK